ncbi:MAG: hypothetical protein WA581_18990 [Candidatus Acidiferrales bacterium]
MLRLDLLRGWRFAPTLCQTLTQFEARGGKRFGLQGCEIRNPGGVLNIDADDLGCVIEVDDDAPSSGTEPQNRMRPSD